MTYDGSCAFLNGERGVILFGVTDNGKIVGQEVSDKTRQEIADAISELEPPHNHKFQLAMFQ